MKQVLKTYQDWELIKKGRTKYFKNGKPHLHVEIIYSIEKVYTTSEQAEIDSNRRVSTGIYWIKTKSEAIKIWKDLVNKHELNGTAVKVGAS